MRKNSLPKLSVLPLRRPSRGLRAPDAETFDRSQGDRLSSAHGDSSTGSELKAVEEACRDASRTVEPWELCASAVNTLLQETQKSLKMGELYLWRINLN